MNEQEINPDINPELERLIREATDKELVVMIVEAVSLDDKLMLGLIQKELKTRKPKV